MDIHNSILSYAKHQPLKKQNCFEVYLFDDDFAGELKSLDLNDYLKKAGQFNLANWKDDENWAFTPKLHKKLFLKIKKIKTKLGDNYNCNQYSNSFRKKYKSILIFDDKPTQIPEEYLRKYRKMGEVRKFSVEPLSNKYIIVIHNKEKAWNDTKLKKFYIQTLPGTLGEAISLLEKSEIARRALGNYILRKLLEAEKAHWDSYRIQVHPWERDKYLAR